MSLIAVVRTEWAGFTRSMTDYIPQAARRSKSSHSFTMVLNDAVGARRSEPDTRARVGLATKENVERDGAAVGALTHVPFRACTWDARHRFQVLQPVPLAGPIACHRVSDRCRG